MPKKMERCVADLIKQGYTKEQAFAICTASIEKTKDTEEEKNIEEQKNNNKPKTLW